MRFIDTHCHIIPGVDDGAPDEKTSLAMAQIAASDGIGTVVATPHVVEGIYDGGDREERLRKLANGIKREGIGLSLVAGVEVPMSMALGNSGLLSRLRLGSSRYLLLETTATTFEQLSQAVYQTRLAGLFPVLAHPERAEFVAKDPGRLARLIEGGDVFCQATVASLEGLFGKGPRKAALDMARSGLVHLVASDAHSAGRRAPRLSASFDLLASRVGEPAARIIMLENPQRLIDDSPLASIESGGASRKGLWSRPRPVHDAVYVQNSHDFAADLNLPFQADAL